MTHPRRCQRLGRWVLGGVVLGLAGLWGLDRLYPPELGRYQRLSSQVLAADGHLLRAFTVDHQWRLAATVEDVAPFYLAGLKVFEDRRFHLHPGVDPLAVVRALWQWLTHGRVISGASTLTMQVARLLEPRPRTLGAKLVEMGRAVQLEWRYDKAEILAMYLTLAPFGGNLEGVRAASLAYFAKEPRHLTPGQAALLVALPQAPSRLRPDRHPARARAARDKVVDRWVRAKLLTPAQGREARSEALPTVRHPMPFSAPHLARRLAAATASGGVVTTAIDPVFQGQLEALAAKEPLLPRHSLAILVVDNQYRRVRAYVAGADFAAFDRQGQVDMIQAVRSPGSTLKPLVYGLGFDAGLIHPATVLDDVPTRFGDYAPRNFHRAFAGQVTVRTALQHSLNVPAVQVLAEVGPTRVADLMAHLGWPLRVAGEAAEDAMGLPLVLGGVGTHLADLVALYCTFANDGVAAPLVYTLDPAASGVAAPQRLLGGLAARQVTEILRTTPPPAPRVVADFAARPRDIAYKTGTSYGFRDAWAVGYDGDYTVGVWTGRPDGSPSPGRYGRNAAAPLLFRVFDLLPPPRRALPGALAGPESPPAHLRRLGPPRPGAGVEPLQLVFPRADSQVELPTDDGVWPSLPLVARGGVRPLRWLVNGRPLPGGAPFKRQASWVPDGAGAVRITVIDGTGYATSAEVWLTPVEP